MDIYIILLIAHKPFKQQSKPKSTVVWCGHVQRALICVVSPAEGGFLSEACSWISTPLTFLSGELWEWLWHRVFLLKFVITPTLLWRGGEKKFWSVGISIFEWLWCSAFIMMSSGRKVAGAVNKLVWKGSFKANIYSAALLTIVVFYFSACVNPSTLKWKALMVAFILFYSAILVCV